MGKGGTTEIDFGAKHAIIVRDDSARVKLRESIGKNGLVLTIFESKGLEFDSVLIHNFAADSKCTQASWRALANAFDPSTTTPFDSRVHYQLKLELQSLYVAVTRARKNPWFFDASGTELKNFLLAGDVIQIHDSKDVLPSLGGDKSTVDDWADLGRSLFEQKLFEQAAAAFERAGDRSNHLTALAYGQRKSARLQEQLQPPPSRLLIRSAYEASGSAFHAAASATPSGRQRMQLFELAGDSFSEAHLHNLAARAFELAAAFDKTAHSFILAKLWTDAVRIIKTQSVSPKTHATVVRLAKIEFCRGGNFKAAREVFDSTEDQIEYMEEYGFDVGVKQIRLSIGDHAGVAEIELGEGNLLKAADMFTKAGEQVRAVEIMVGLVWNDLTVGIFDAAGAARLVETKKLVQKIMRLKVNNIAARHKFSFLKEIAAAEIDTAKLTTITQSDSPLNHRILALDAVLASSPAFHQLETPDAEALLLRFETYHQLLKLTLNLDTSAPVMQQLYGFRSSLDGIELLSSSPLNSTRLVTPVDQLTSPTSAQNVVKRYVGARIFGQLARIEAALVNRNELRPFCAELLFTGVCKTRLTTCRQQHCSVSGLEEASRTTTRLLRQLVSLFKSSGPLALTRDERDFVEKSRRRFTGRLTARGLSAHARMGTLDGLVTEDSDTKRILVAFAEDQLYALRVPQLDRALPPYFLPNLVASTVISGELNPTFRNKCYKLPVTNVLSGSQFGLLAQAIFESAISLNSRRTESIQESSLKAVVQSGSIMLGKNGNFDLAAFLHLAEEALILATIGSRLGTEKFDSRWQGLTLPLGTMQSMLRKHRGRGIKITSANGQLVVELVYLLVQIIEALYDHDGYLSFEGRIIEIHHFIRHIFIFRIVQSIAIAGINSNIQIKQYILRSLQQISTKTPERRYINRLVLPFVDARIWNEVEQALFASMKSGAASEQLVAISFMLHPVVPSRAAIRIVTSNSLEGVYQKLSKGLPSIDLLVPSQISTATTPTVMVEEDEKVTEVEGPVGVASTLADERIDRSQATTASEEKAARSLQRLWRVRRDVRQKNAVAVTSDREALNSAFAKYVSVVKIGSSLKVLGLLPHLLVALQSTRARFEVVKKKLKAEFLSAEGERLDLIHDLIPQKKIPKAIDAMIKMISPTSTFDSHLSFSNLLPLVTSLLHDAQMFFDAATPTKGLDGPTMENYRVFCRGLEERKIQVPLPVEKKPVLKMEGEYDYDYEDSEGEEEAEAAGRKIAARMR